MKRIILAALIVCYAALPAAAFAAEATVSPLVEAKPAMAAAAGRVSTSNAPDPNAGPKPGSVPFNIRQDELGSAKTDAMTGMPYQAETETQVPPVKFKKIDPPSGLQARIDRLVEGITTDIPPQYDYYGYEIRRYMQHTGNAAVYANSARIDAESLNVKKAKIILGYWNDYLAKEISDISDVIDKTNASSSIRNSFKYNSGIVSAFQQECQQWLDANNSLMDFLQKDKGSYTFADPKFVFNSDVDEAAFATLFDARERARKEMNKYHSFSSVIY